MALSTGYSTLKRLTSQAFSMLLDSPEQNPSLVAYSRYSLPVKHKYARPEFLELDEETTSASADHEIRPVMHNRKSLVMNAGYAEVINAGKTMKINEDQSSTSTFVVTVPIDRQMDGWKPDKSNLVCIYFAVFDGHAGSGAALFASQKLHYHVKEKLTEVSHMVVLNEEEMANRYMSHGLITSICSEHLIIGALEQAFLSLDQELKQERFDFRIDGGCTALVALFMCGKLYIANAGDSRAVLYEDFRPVLETFDHCPDTERKRIQYVAYTKPSLLCDEYTRLQFQHRARKKDLGTKQLYRDWYMDGWALKTIEKNDVRPQLISGEGKRARLLDTIGTTRGFGDHDLDVPYCPNIKIKPFMSAHPQVLVYDMQNKSFGEDDVLVLATDGLWEKFDTCKVGSLLQAKLASLPTGLTHRYTVAAQGLADEARGILGERGWRSRDNEMASYDDISVFVIPLHMYKVVESNLCKSSVSSLPRSRGTSSTDGYVYVPRDVTGCNAFPANHSSSAALSKPATDELAVIDPYSSISNVDIQRPIFKQHVVEAAVSSGQAKGDYEFSSAGGDCVLQVQELSEARTTQHAISLPADDFSATRN